MLDDVRVERGNRLRALRKALGLSRQALGKKHAISASAIQNWEEGRYNGLNNRSAERMASVFQQEGLAICRAEWLLYGTGADPLQANPVTRRGTLLTSTVGGQDLGTIIQELQFFHQLYAGAGTTIDAVVADNSMQPLVRRGDYVAGIRYFEPDLPVLDVDCIVQLTSGETLIRHVAAGTHPHRYKLTCYHPTATKNPAILKDVEIFSAAPILRIWRQLILPTKK